MSQELAYIKEHRRVPLYKRLADEIRTKVASGILKAGQHISSQDSLAIEYGVASGTAGQALNELVREGVLERIQGKGTFVREPNIEEPALGFFRVNGEAGGDYKVLCRVLSRSVEPAPNIVAENLSIAHRESVLRVRRLHLVEASPILIEDIWLPASLFEALMNSSEDELAGSLYRIYSDKCGKLVANIDEMFFIEGADNSFAEKLCLEVNDPLIVINGLAKDCTGLPLEWRQIRGRSDLFCYRREISQLVAPTA